MPSTIVKLSSGHARAWAHNQPVWLTAAGDIERPVTRAEQHAISRALERTQKVTRSFRLELTLEDVVATSHGMVRRRVPLGRRPVQSVPEKINCAFEVTCIGTKRVVTVWLGPLRYATGREVIAAQILAEHGECVLHGRNGKCIYVLRDPLVAEREPNYGKRVQYSRTHDEAAAAEEQLSIALEEPEVAPVKQSNRSTRFPTQRPARAGGRVLPKPVTRAAPPRKTGISPDSCPNDCRGRRGGQAWSLAKDAVPPTEQQHHPVCKFARDWDATLSKPETSSVLYDLELGRVARGAMPEEIEEADHAERTTTMRNITVAGRLYAVLPRDEADLAEREARGETVELPPVKVAPPAAGPQAVAATPRRPLPPMAPAPSAEQLQLRATGLAIPSEPDGPDDPAPRYEPEAEPELESEAEREPEPIELSADETDEHEMPTEPAPPPVAARAAAVRGPRVLIEEVSENDVAGSDEQERESWPELDTLANAPDPETYRKRAEVTARSYLARTPAAPTSLGSRT